MERLRRFLGLNPVPGTSESQPLKVTGEVKVLRSQVARLENDKVCLSKDLYSLNDQFQIQKQQLAQAERKLAMLRAFVSGPIEPYFQVLERTKSQLLQDLFVLHVTGFRRNGFFVEFGACDGLKLSNTYLLETEYGWRGILAEPGRVWRESLQKNRHCHIEEKCVWSRSGETLTFNEVDVDPGLSSLESSSFNDHHSASREKGTRYSVETISLTELLNKFGAPSTVDYLSIDTEGSEFEILNAFDFSQYKFRAITCEHNFGPQREAIRELLEKNGYRRVYTEFSQFDDWYEPKIGVTDGA